MIRFNCDYLEGAHPRILEKLVETNFVQTPGYGTDEYCERAREIIRKKCGVEDAYVQFLVGGTQTNTTVIASILKPYQGVLSAVTGHINAHETGAIEATGHKVLALPSEDGKSLLHRCRKLMMCTGQMHPMNILYSQEWYIFPIQQKTGLYIPKKN